MSLEINPRASELTELKQQLGRALKTDSAIQPHGGVPTSNQSLNQFLLWNGFPKGGLSLIRGHNGLGSTSLWTGAAADQTKQKKWVAWLSPSRSLFPLTLKAQGVDLSLLWNTIHPFDGATWLWILNELIESELFDLIGCDLADNNFSSRQWMKLKRQVRKGQVAAVFIQRGKPHGGNHNQNYNNALFSLSLEFTAQQLQVHRALHRPTPWSTPLSLPRSNLYAHLMSQFTEKSTLRSRGDLSQIQFPRTVSQ